MFNEIFDGFVGAMVEVTNAMVEAENEKTNAVIGLSFIKIEDCLTVLKSAGFVESDGTFKKGGKRVYVSKKYIGSQPVYTIKDTESSPVTKAVRKEYEAGREVIGLEFDYSYQAEELLEEKGFKKYGRNWLKDTLRVSVTPKGLGYVIKEV